MPNSSLDILLTLSLSLAVIKNRQAYSLRLTRRGEEANKLLDITRPYLGADKAMKRFNLSKVAGSAILATSLAVMPLTLPAGAQTGVEPGVDAVEIESEDDGFDWGWLGLLGLLGLAGLAGKKRKETTHYQTTVDPSTRTPSDYR
jgi:LPXTG-motif cell wall-anchored protein